MKAIIQYTLTSSRTKGLADSLRRILNIACFLPSIALWIAVKPVCDKIMNRGLEHVVKI